MNKKLTLILSATFLGLSHLHAVEHPDASNWQDLIAKDFSNCADPGKWTMEDGVMVAKDHETLWTQQSYGDFILDLEFKVAK